MWPPEAARREGETGARAGARNTPAGRERIATGALRPRNDNAERADVGIRPYNILLASAFFSPPVAYGDSPLPEGAKAADAAGGRDCHGRVAPSQ